MTISDTSYVAADGEIDDFPNCRWAARGLSNDGSGKRPSMRDNVRRGFGFLIPGGWLDDLADVGGIVSGMVCFALLEGERSS